VRGNGVDSQHTFDSSNRKSKIFFFTSLIFPISRRGDRQSGTTYGRTTKREWKVLRDTDGERFVLQNKVSTFSGEFVSAKKENQRARIYFKIETLLYAIIYPLATELFASRKDRLAITIRMNLALVNDGPP
jgi:hypothetical protein